MSPVVLPLLVLVALANGTPLIARRIFGRRFTFPVDGDRAFIDGRPLFGPAKTVRGVICAVFAATAGGAFLGLGWRIGLLVGGLAMVGDLFSSFVKRRLGRAASAPAVGIDQIPEALFPLLGCLGPLSLSLADVAVGVVLFFVGELGLSRLLYAFNLRDRPY